MGGKARTAKRAYSQTILNFHATIFNTELTTATFFNTGRIEVHSPQKLESHVLKKYFRHSKFASFQRQLNYFGFRKLAGKGKMAPCSYVNEAALDDIGSLFQIKVSMA